MDLLILLPFLQILEKKTVLDINVISTKSPLRLTSNVLKYEMTSGKQILTEAFYSALCQGSNVTTQNAISFINLVIYGQNQKI